ncbi:eukaryotic translation initiation factor 4 gamma 3-like isoform X3 [Ceratina calcarata]|uniref:Eukaryotic translation initiation factor 4 gamma 3-like isoform X3 n=1 Tax=Ceratina calcarata TaxID=156304 RepID=A0AAJ7NE83_9HYME|nr:eukaryotic translation initiation factor 4 gamma 3-like isoform X3 [Ceratina calcarata]
MVSRYGVSKEGAVGVAVGVGPMHCLLPHCVGPHHHHHLSAPHPQNPQPGHNHHVHPAHQPPPSPSPHLNHQLSHHQLTVNINHLSHQQQQQQQTQHQQAPPQYRVVTANARSDFHVSGQNYGTQPGGQVGGGGGSVGVPGGRGPPPLGGLQSIGQSAAGIPPGGPAGGQAPPQNPAPGVQSQPPQGPAPTTTPPVHTPSPQEMGKQAHLQPQPQPLSQVYGPAQTRPTTQGYYPGPRPQQPRGISHRGGQGGTGAQVVGMSGVGGGGGQPTAIYHPGGGMVQTGTMYQVPSLHHGPHQQSVYSMNSQIPPLQFGGPPQRHQTHQNQSYFPPFQHSAILTAQNMFAYNAPPPTPPYFYPTATTPLISRPGASAVTGGAQHVTGPLAGAQGAPVVPQGTLQQPTQQAQPLPPMGISLSQSDVYSGHNGGATNTTNSTTKSRKPRGQNAITDIVDPSTGKNISHEIYNYNETIQSGESSNRETPQPQNNNAEVQADFAARVAKTLVKNTTDESGSDSTVVTTCVQNTTSTTQNVTQSLSHSQTNSTNDASNNQCNSGSSATQNLPNVTALCSQSLGSTVASNAAQTTDSCTVKTESKPLQIPVKEFQPRSETKSVVVEEPAPLPAPARNVNKDDISAQLSTVTVVPEVDPMKGISTTPAVTQMPVPVVSTPSTNVPEVPKPSATAPSANPVPAREPFPNLSSKNSSSSPPRRKSQTHAHNQPAAAAPPVAAATATVTTTPPATTELPPSAKEQKEKKTREKSLSSRGTTPTPAHNQTADHHHFKANGDVNAEKQEPEPPRTEVQQQQQQQKSSDGKPTQKQKNKSKLKPRELNRKGAEKEGTDMDAFVHTTPSGKPEVKQDGKEVLPPKDSNKDTNREITKDLKEKENYESKKEKEATSGHAKTEKQASPVTTPEIPKETAPVQAPAAEKLPSNKETIKESSPKIEDSKKSNVCSNTQTKSVPNDVVDHAKVKEEADVQTIVAQKNEENSKVSAISAPNEEKQQAIPVIEKSAETEPIAAPVEPAPATANQIQLKYKYKDDQWSPINKSGKKVYDRDFLIKLQNDPNSKIKPTNLPDLDVVLKDSSKVWSTRTSNDLRAFKDSNMRHDLMFPGFVKPSMNARMPPPNRKSHPGKSSKPVKPNVIHVSLSLREDVKLRETENAWRPTRLKNANMPEEDAKTEALYKKVRSVLNKLTPQKFNTLIDQVRALNIDTRERLQGVINLVFEKAVDEPSFSVAYALMCKELAMMQVPGNDQNVEKESSFSFKKLIITRCQKEFEKNPVNEVARTRKLKEIEECTDPEKKKDLQIQLEEEERKTRIKSVGNIRFIGELFRQGMLTTNIMHRCMTDLLNQSDEDNLECLCKLLTTVGRDLEAKAGPQDMQDYFNKMQDIVARRNQGKISSRIRFMLQDVIDLRANKWIPRRDDSNPKTIDQIQKEAESERLDNQLSNTPLNTPRKDERASDRKRNRGTGPTDDGGWSQPVVRTRPQYSIETAKLKNKPPPMDDLQLGSRNMYMWKVPQNCGSKAINSNKFACLQLENISTLDQDKRITSPQLSGSRSTGPREYGRDYKPSYDGRSSRNGSHQLSSSSSSRESSLLDSSQSQGVSMPPPPLKSSQSTSSSHKPPMTDEEFDKTLHKIIKEYLKNPILETVSLAIQQNFDNALSKFIRELVNFVLEKTPLDRERVSYLLSHLIMQKILSVTHLRNGLVEILEIIDDLLLDIPKVWLYLAEILSHPIEQEVLPLNELKPVFDSLRSQGYVGIFLGELLSKVCRDKGPKWVADKWDQSGLQLNSLIDPEREEVDKIIKNYNLEFCTGDYITYQQIHDELRILMKDSGNFDVICNWIIANVGNRVKEPEFIRVLTTAILETSMEYLEVNNKHQLKNDVFTNLQQLIRRFVDTNESLELQCLYAIQLHLHNLQYPHGLLFNIMTNLSDYNIISSDAFLTWKKSPEPAQREWHGVATMALTSFFTGLQEADDASSVEDVSTGVNQDRC